MENDLEHYMNAVSRLHREKEAIEAELTRAHEELVLLRDVADAASAELETAECRGDEDCDHCVLVQALKALDQHRRAGEAK